MAITSLTPGALVEVASGNLASVPLAASFQADDIFICVVTAADNVALTFPGGWTIKAAANNGATQRQTIAWRRAVTGDAAFTITHAAGNTAVARVLGFRGCTKIGDPIEAILQTANTSSTTVTANAITTLTSGCAIIFAGTSTQVGTSNQNAQSVATGTNPTFVELTDNQGVAGSNEADQATDWGIKTDASTTGNRTTTLSVNATVNIGTLLALTADVPSDGYRPVRIANRNVGPMALRHSFKQPYYPQTDAITSTNVSITCDPPSALVLGSIGPVITDTVIPSAGVLNLTSTAPALAESFTPAAGILILGGVSPNLADTVTATAGILVLGAGTQVLTENYTVPPGILNLGATSPTFSETITPPAGVINLGGGTHIIPSAGGSVNLWRKLLGLGS